MLSTDLSFVSPEIERLLGTAVSSHWTVPQDPLWSQDLDTERLEQTSPASLLQGLPTYRALSIPQQNKLRYKEGVYHLHNLMAGEHLGVFLAAQIMVRCPQKSLDHAYFASTILSDERNHLLVLRRYLRDKVRAHYDPHPRLQAIFAELMQETSYEVKLFVAQLCLEWTAVSLITSIQFKNSEPLLRNILAAIVRDEGRHLQFNRWVFSQLTNDRVITLQRRMEEIFFEATVAVVSSFFAIPVWQEFGFSEDVCRQHVLRDLHERGAVRYFTKILPKQLARCRFQSDRLIHLLETELEQRVASAHWNLRPIEAARGPVAADSPFASTEVRGV